MAEGSKGTVFSFFILTLIFASLYFLFPQTYTLIFFISALFIFSFSVFFFRDPHRNIPNIPNALISPADGKILLVEDLEKHPYSDGKAKLISVFLNLQDVHVNRIPMDGKITSVEYRPGKFLKAFVPEAGDLNEQYLFILETQFGKIYMKQIAGIIARRLVCHIKNGDNVSVGEKFGLMKFSSRIDMIIPESFEIFVKPGQKVVGGETIIAKVNNEN